MIDLTEANKLVNTFDGKCMDGRVCKKEANGFILANGVKDGKTTLVAVCWDCLQASQKEQETEKNALFKEFLEWKEEKSQVT